MSIELGQIETVHQQARKDIYTILGECPEEYRILIFNNPDIQVSVNRIIDSAGTPQAILTAEEVNHLRSARLQDFLPTDKKTIFNSLPTIIYLTVPYRELNKEKEFILRTELVHALAHAYMNEKTESNSVKIMSRLYQIDVILKELMSNNVYKMNKISNRGYLWAWQYFQDLIGIIRLFTESGIDDFYIPPDEARDITLFNNFSIEAINLLKERAKIARKKHNHILIEEGFAHYIKNKFLTTILDDYEFKKYPKGLKPLMAPPVGILSYALIQRLLKQVETEKILFKKLFNYKTDLELLEEFSYDVIKNILATENNKHSESVIEEWHTSRTNWTDVWSVYAYKWRELEDYAKTTYRRKFSTFGQLHDYKPKISFKGYVRVDEKKVHVFEIDEHGVGLDQLVILHNHSSLYRDDFRTILPAFADIVLFRKITGLHIASLFAVHKKGKEPLSPYNLPVITRAVHVSKRRDAYDFELDEEKEEKVDVNRIDYTYLNDLSQPQRRAIKYLIKEGMYFV